MVTMYYDSEDGVYYVDGEDDNVGWFQEYLKQREMEKIKGDSDMGNDWNGSKSSTGTHSYSGSGTGTGTGGHSSSGTSYQWTSHKPSLAFEHDGIQFIGTAKTYLDDIVLYDTDLIINCTGIKFVPRPAKPFIKEVPAWLDIQADTEGNAAKPPPQLLLDWTDFGVPPERIDLNFWESILEGAKRNDIDRIIVCCVGGSGRTGTALAALAIASGVTVGEDDEAHELNEPDEAIVFIRKEYHDKAIENKAQELYIWNLVYTDEEIFGDKDQKKIEPEHSNLPVKVFGTASGPSEADDLDVWMNNYGMD